MKMKFTHPKILLVLVFLLTATAVKAQIANVAGLASGTLAAYCNGTQVKLTAASTGASLYTWKRYAGNGVSGGATTVSGQTTANMVDTPPAPGYYTYVSTSTNTDGCESPASDPVVIYVLPDITATITSSDATISKYCVSSVPTTLTLTAQGTNTQAAITDVFAYNYQWYKNSTLIAGANTSTYTLSASADAALGNNAYTCRVSYQIKNCGDVTSNIITFNVIDLPGKPTVTITP